MQAQMSVKEMSAVLRRNYSQAQMKEVLEDSCLSWREGEDLAARIAHYINDDVLSFMIIEHSRSPDLTYEDRLFLRVEKGRLNMIALKYFDEMFGTRYQETVSVTIRIGGVELLDMYDNEPRDGVYDIPGHRSFSVPAFTAPDALRKLAESHFKQLEHEHHTDPDFLGEGFAPKTIRIEDAAGCITAYYERGKWLESFLDEEEIAQKQRAIIEMRTAASDERRWDNFHGARRIETEIERLQTIIELSKMQSQLPSAA